MLSQKWVVEAEENKVPELPFTDLTAILNYPSTGVAIQVLILIRLETNWISFSKQDYTRVFMQD